MERYRVNPVCLVEHHQRPGGQSPIAYRIIPNVSVARGFNYMMAKVEGKTMVDQSALGGRDGELRLKGDGDGWGYNFGILYSLSQPWNLGLAYRSDIQVNYRGDLRLSNIASPLQPLLGGPHYVTDIRTSQHFPKLAGLGIAFRPTNRWTFNMELEWDGWSSFDQSVIELDKKVPAADLTNRVNRFDWKDTWAFKAGIEYKVNERLSLRGGYVYALSPVPDHTLDPSNPDSNHHDISLGVGYTWGRYVVDFFSMAAFCEERTVQNSILSGTYKPSVQYLFGISLGAKF